GEEAEQAPLRQCLQLYSFLWAHHRPSLAAPLRPSVARPPLPPPWASHTSLRAPPLMGALVRPVARPTEGVPPARVPFSRTRSSAPAPLPPLPPLHGDGGERGRKIGGSRGGKRGSAAPGPPPFSYLPLLREQ
ncbi:unnamed protein product, partial [Closterium sp. NIES-54]